MSGSDLGEDTYRMINVCNTEVHQCMLSCDLNASKGLSRLVFRLNKRKQVFIIFNDSLSCFV
jgi:hypothetical protein